MIKAAFLDRDGVINRDTGYVYRAEDLELLPGALDGLRILQQAGYLLVVVTNQAGIARGLYTAADYETFTAALRAILEGQGVQLAAVYSCPHLESAPCIKYGISCNCRKPAPGMLLQAIAEHGISPDQSVLIGDRISDIRAGRAAGVARCYLISSTQSETLRPPEADASFKSLEDCARFLRTLDSNFY